MEMKDRLIEKIKDCRAESERRWTPQYGYGSSAAHAQAILYDKWADWLEGLVREIEEG